MMMAVHKAMKILVKAILTTTTKAASDAAGMVMMDKTLAMVVMECPAQLAGMANKEMMERRQCRDLHDLMAEPSEAACMTTNKTAGKAKGEKWRHTERTGI